MSYYLPALDCKLHEAGDCVCPNHGLIPSAYVYLLNEWMKNETMQIELTASLTTWQGCLSKMKIRLQWKIIPLKIWRWTLHIPSFVSKISALFSSIIVSSLRVFILVALLITLKHHSTVAVLTILLSRRDKEQRLVVLSFK